MDEENDTEAAMAAALAADEKASAPSEPEPEEPTVRDGPTFDATEYEDLGDDIVPPAAFDPVNPDLGVILDIPVQISMVVGNSQISIRNLLQLNQGSVVELDRMAGEPLEVLVNNTLIAHGEVVVVNERFGIRLTDVVSAAERIRNLG